MTHLFTKKLFAALLGTAALAFAACTDSDAPEQTPGGVSGNAVTITVTIPGMETPSATRSIADAGGEAVVSTIDILVFDDSAPTPKLLEHAEGTNPTLTGGANYEIRFQASLTNTSAAKSVVILANAGSLPSQAKVKGTSKVDILEALTHKMTNADWKWNANTANVTPVAGTNYDAIPMYAEEKLPNGITFGMNIPGIELIRMLARIDVENNAATDFDLTKVYVVNYNTAGYIAPAWNANGTLLASPANPMIPSTPINDPQIGIDDAMKYAYSSYNGGNGMFGEIYTYEALATNGKEGTNGHTNAVCLLLEGTYKEDGKTYFYRVDFTSGDATGKYYGETGFDMTTVGYMPLYRNHRYTVDITRVDGIGYTDAAKALKSLGIMNNLKTILHVVDEREIVSTVFNGQHYLGVGKEVELGPDKDETVSVLVTTNYAGGWQIDTTQGKSGIEYITGTNWLMANKPGADTDKSAYLQLQTTSDNDSVAGKEAYVHLVAGRLRHKVKVIQLAPYIRITDKNGNVVNELIFESKNSMVATNTPPAPQTFKVEWAPASSTVTIEKNELSIANAEFTWQDISTKDLATFSGDGSYTFTIDPAGFTADEIKAYPFMEKGSTMEFSLGGATASINLRQIHYNIVAEDVKLSYPLDGGTHNFTITSNAPWMISAITGNIGFLETGGDLAVSNTGGTPNEIESEQVSFKVINDQNSSGTVTVDFVSTPSPGKFDDLSVTLNFINASYAGFFAGDLVKNSNNEWQFERQMYVQTVDESTGMQWETSIGSNSGVTGDVNGKVNTFKLRSKSTSLYPANNQCFQKNTNYASINSATHADYNWYLPAAKQLMAVWVVQNSFNGSSKLNSNSYWSSTESGTNTAWYVFGTGHTDNGNVKDGDKRVRCVWEK